LKAGFFTQELPDFPAHITGLFPDSPDQEMGELPVGRGPSSVQPAVGCLGIFRIQKRREAVRGGLYPLPGCFYRHFQADNEKRSRPFQQGPGLIVINKPPSRGNNPERRLSPLIVPGALRGDQASQRTGFRRPEYLRPLPKEAPGAFPGLPLYQFVQIDKFAPGMFRQDAAGAGFPRMFGPGQKDGSG
jgi:hypothetical protein